jgi:hypothetical protein
VPLTAATSEQIEAYIKLCAENRANGEKHPQVAKNNAQGTKKKLPKARKKFLTTKDESVVLLARAVGDPNIKKANVIVETKRRY